MMHGFLLLLLAASPSEGLHDRSVVSQPTVAPRHSRRPLLVTASRCTAALGGARQNLASSYGSALQLRGGASGMSVATAWAILFGATCFELISTWFMHAAKGFSLPLPAIGAVLTYGASFYAFNLSLRALEISIAYSVWSSVVMAALSVIGMTWLGESVSATKIVGITAIIVGTVCLAMADTSGAA